jgi:NAD(P)-dependent dehydrogenase (short-subunit alcohol dehydrogenase family)
MCKPATRFSSSSSLFSSLFNALISLTIAIYTLGFLFFRIAELVSLVSLYPTHSLSASLGTIAIQCAPTIGRWPKRIAYIATLLGVIYAIDFHLPKPLPKPSDVHTGKTVVITGANSGLGYETARQLAVHYGMNVILGCRSKVKCDAAAQAINNESVISSSGGKATPMIVDLSDFRSVKSFATQLQDVSIDVLFNNAGYAPDSNLPVNQYGLDPSFTSMHLSHFLLTEELLKRHPSLRVVNTSSGTHHLCAIPFTVFPTWLLEKIPVDQNPGCVDADFLHNGIYSQTDSAAYINAKVANIMHVVEIPLHHSMATAAAIDLGWVGTSIQSFMEGSFTPTSIGWMRSVDIGVLPAMHAILSTNDELLDNSNDLMNNRQWKDGGIVMGVFGRTAEAFVFDWFWKEESLGRSKMLELSKGLWNVSKQIVENHAT